MTKTILLATVVAVTILGLTSASIVLNNTVAADHGEAILGKCISKQIPGEPLNVFDPASGKCIPSDECPNGVSVGEIISSEIGKTIINPTHCKLITDDTGSKVSVTVNLDGIKLKTGEVMVLLDTTGQGTLSSVHVATNLPCNITGDGKPTVGAANDEPGIWIVAGVAGPNLSGVINDASDDTGFAGPENTCVFHDTIDAADVLGGVITDVIIVHPNNHPDADKKDVTKHEKLKGVVVTITGTYN